jgi:hypothetical protein
MSFVAGEQDIDMMAATSGEEYFNHRTKIFCLEATKGNVFGQEFLECVKRSNKLFTKYYQGISAMALEMNMQEDDTDPSVLLGGGAPTQ